MSSLWEFVVFVGGATDQVLAYLERHHWFFGFIIIGYIFYLHDKSLHARFDAVDKRLDEIRKRLACGSWTASGTVDEGADATQRSM